MGSLIIIIFYIYKRSSLLIGERRKCLAHRNKNFLTPDNSRELTAPERTVGLRTYRENP